MKSTPASQARPPVSIRRWNGAEASALLPLWRAAVEATHHFLTAEDVDGYEVVVAQYLPLIEDLRVAEDGDGQALGIIAQEGGEIHMLFVHPASHGQGIGTALIDDVAAGQPLLRVDVNEQNPGGRRFYEAKGFREVGRSPVDGQGRPFPLLHLQR